MAATLGGEARRRSAVDSEIHLFVVSHRNLTPRTIHFTVAALGALAFAPFPWVALWFCVTAAVVLAGTWLCARVERWRAATREAWGVPALLGVTTLNSVLYGVGAAALWRTGNAIAGAFAVLILAICIVYSLMQYYAHPRLFYVVAAPYIAGFGYIIVAIAAAHLPIGDYGAIGAVACAAVALGNLIYTARRNLAGSRSALRQARALATEREQAAAAANAAKSIFLATMSHEIRTPLNGVLGMAQAMAADELASAQRERLGIITQSGETLLAILNDVLDLSKMEAGKLDLEAAEFDLAAQIGGVCAAFGALAEAKGLELSWRVSPEAEGVYLGDAVRLRQLITNLVSNGLKFTEVGQVSVEADATAAGLILRVRDTGVGIDAEALGRLFEDFMQADASTTRRFGGTGLGLAICRRLSRMMGGTIEAESELGRGALFTVTLPLERLRDSEPAEASAAATEDAAELDAVRVLAAEDNEVNRLVLKTLLAQVGVEPRLVVNGREAVEAWSREPWDVILMDVQMPEMDGPTAAREIRVREAAEGRSRTPIIALTANVLAHQIGEYLDAGMDAHVAKPIEAGRLFAALQEALAMADEAAEPDAARA
jgi:signal transduction histidine kinase/ActR/RegA family two-component response regulator